MKKEEYYRRLEKAIEFVESNLNNDISLSDVSKHAFSSLSHFHRIFYFMTGTTLKEYIRSRRLSYAAIELISTKKTIIDIAFEAQFDSPESFNKSFKKMFTFSPREFRKQKPEFQVVRRMELSQELNIDRPNNITLEYVYLPKQVIMGVKTRTTLENKQQTQDIPKFFHYVMESKLLTDIHNVIDHQKIFGIYSDMSDEEKFDYTVGLLVENTTLNCPRFSTHTLPASEYARFTVKGNPSELETAWQYIYGIWMLTSENSRQKGYDFEIYYPAKTDIYIPMKSGK